VLPIDMNDELLGGLVKTSSQTGQLIYLNGAFHL
jgi:hypothetical protein